MDLFEEPRSLHVAALLDRIKQILYQHTPVWGAEEEYGVGGFEQRVERSIIAGGVELGFDKSLEYPSAVSDRSTSEPSSAYMCQQNPAVAMTDEEQRPL